MTVYSARAIVALRPPLSTARQGQMVAQGPAGIVGAKHATLLEDRYDLIGEGVELAGEEGRHDVEAVGGARLEPALDHVGDLNRRADQQQVTACGGDPVVEFAQ